MPIKFNLVKKGYSPQEVDRYIDELEQLVMSYRKKDAAITNAILSAQVAADEITHRANVAADTIVQNARNMSFQVMETTAKQMDGVLKLIHAQKGKLRDFRQDYSDMLEKYLRDINDDDMRGAEEKLTALETYINNIMDVDLSRLESDEDDDKAEI